MKPKTKYLIAGSLLGIALGLSGIAALRWRRHSIDAAAPRCEHSRGFDGLRFERPYRQYQADDVRRKRVLENYKFLEVGMTEQQVWDLLGQPDVATENWAKERSRGCVGTGWQYWIDLRHDSANENDLIIEIFFTQKGLVHWISPRKGLGLPEKGGPIPVM